MSCCTAQPTAPSSGPHTARARAHRRPQATPSPAPHTRHSAAEPPLSLPPPRPRQPRLRCRAGWRQAAASLPALPAGAPRPLRQACRAARGPTQACWGYGPPVPGAAAAEAGAGVLQPPGPPAPPPTEARQAPAPWQPAASRAQREWGARGRAIKQACLEAMCRYAQQRGGKPEAQPAAPVALPGPARCAAGRGSAGAAPTSGVAPLAAAQPLPPCRSPAPLLRGSHTLLGHSTQQGGAKTYCSGKTPA